MVLDNAETVSGLALFEWLARRPAPSKSLLTSRAVPPAHIPCRMIELPPLDAAQSRELLAALLAHSPLAATPGALDQLLPLATAAGGNPKAIEIAIGLARRQPLAEIVAALEAARLEDLFTPLFERAWALLDAETARVLLAHARGDLAVALLIVLLSAGSPPKAARLIRPSTLSQAQKPTVGAPTAYVL